MVQKENIPETMNCLMNKSVNKGEVTESEEMNIHRKKTKCF